MESFGITIFVIVVIVIVIAYFSSPRKKYEKEVSRRTGIDKLSLMVGKDSIYLGNQFKKQNDDDPLWFSVNLSVIGTHQTLSGGFYSLLGGAAESFGNKELFDELSNEALSNNSKRLEISSKMFGLSFGVVMKRVADAIGAEIKKPMIKKFIDSCEFDEIHKKEIIKMVTAYLDLETSDTEKRWASLEKITYALMGASIKRDKNDVADPTMIMPLRTALDYAYNKATFDNSAIKELEKQGIIKANKKSQNQLTDGGNDEYDDV